MRKRIAKLRKWTFNCPLCGAKKEVIADPNDNSWRCWSCRAGGTFAITWNVSEPGLPKEEK
jgi:transcription elongation factor Elf1